MRSVILSALWYCENARAIASLRSVIGQQIEADVLERAPSGALRVRPIGTGRDHSPIGRRERGAVPLADRRAQPAARGEYRIGIDVAADLARDVGLARRRERERDEGGLEFFVRQDGAERGHEAVVLAHRRSRSARPRRSPSGATSPASAPPASG